MDALKETLDAWLARIKSPVLGYIVLAFVLVNWKPLWFLVFAEQDVETKLAFFDEKTDQWSLYIWPLVYGLGAAIAAPWAEWLGALIARWPSLLRKKIQDNHDTEVLIAALDNAARLEVTKVEREEKKQAAIEFAALERAKRNQSALEIGGDAVSELQEARASGQSGFEQVANNLNEIDRILIKILKKNSRLDEIKFAEEAAIFLSKSGPEKYNSGHRALVETQAGISRLKNMGLAQIDNNFFLNLTERGYRLADVLVS